MQDGFERLHCRCGVAGNIDDKPAAECAGNGAAHGGEGSRFQSLAAHELAEPIQDAFADRACGLRGDVAGRNSSTPRGNDKLRPPCLLAQGGDNLFHLIRKDQNSLNVVIRLTKTSGNRGPGTVFAQTCKTRVAYRDDNCVHNRDFTSGEMAQASGAQDK